MDRDNWIRLARSLNTVLFWKLLNRYRSPTEALATLGGKEYTLAALHKEKDNAARSGCVWVLYGDPHYPGLLRTLPDPPPVLLVRGNTAILGRRIVAMVGARNCSAVGADFAYSSARAIGQTGLVVASGMARGIDTAAHRGALSTGTIAVLAGGVDCVYPEDNRKLYYDIVAQGGAILSESAMETPPLARYFPGRNRVITGMSSAVVVIEAAMKSGSLMTARLAMEYNREVFAVPGHPTDPRSRGGNFLIKNGASMFESYEDLEGLEIDRSHKHDTRNSECSGEEPKEIVGAESMAATLCAEVLSILSVVPISIEELAGRLERDVSQVRVMIAELELDGAVRVLRDGCVVRA
jgi:DNA processing protein